MKPRHTITDTASMDQRSSTRLIVIGIITALVCAMTMLWELNVTAKFRQNVLVSIDSTLFQKVNWTMTQHAFVFYDR